MYPLGPITVAVTADVEVRCSGPGSVWPSAPHVLTGDVGGPKYPKSSINRLIVAPFLGPL